MLVIYPHRDYHTSSLDNGSLYSIYVRLEDKYAYFLSAVLICQERIFKVELTYKNHSRRRRRRMAVRRRLIVAFNSSL
jgi:hypothetical protein